LGLEVQPSDRWTGSEQKWKLKRSQLLNRQSYGPETWSALSTYLRLWLKKISDQSENEKFPAQKKSQVQNTGKIDRLRKI
jgi:hypothetical protein